LTGGYENNAFQAGEQKAIESLRDILTIPTLAARFFSKIFKL
jgi:hypothetical protein